MLFELEVGSLIRRSNPYTNGQCNTMHFYPVAPGTLPPAANPAGLAAALTAAAQANAAYVNAPDAATLQAAQQADIAADAAMDLSHIDVGVDNDFKQEYMTWTFRGRPQAVKRAIRIRYRFAVTDENGNPTGVYATEHLLIGFAGSNG